MGIFNNNQQSFTELDVAARRYKNARTSIIIVLLFTVVNIILAIVGSGAYFLYSQFSSYSFGVEAAYCFMSPEEMGLTADEGMIAGIIELAIAIILLLPYLLCWIFSKKSHIWVIIALVVTVLDFGYMVLLIGFDTSFILEYIFHIAIIVELALGIGAGTKLKKASEEQAMTDSVDATFTEDAGNNDDFNNVQ